MNICTDINAPKGELLAIPRGSGKLAGTIYSRGVGLLTQPGDICYLVEVTL